MPPKAHGYRYFSRLGIVTGVQFFMGWLPLFLQSQYPTYALPFWPASGTSLAAVLLWGPGMALGVYFGLAMNILIFCTPASVGTMAVASLINVAETMLAWLLLTKLPGNFNPALSRLSDLLRFVLLAPWIPALASSLLTQIWLTHAGILPSTAFESEFWVYFMGNATGIVVIAPLCLVWADFRKFEWRSSQGGGLVLLVLSLGMGLWLYESQANFILGPFLGAMLLPLVLAGIWFTGLRGAAVVGLFSALMFFAFEFPSYSSFLSYLGSKIPSLDAGYYLDQVYADDRDVYYYPEYYSTMAKQMGLIFIFAGTILPLGAAVDHLRRWQALGRISQKQSEDSFWTWDQDLGYRIYNQSVAKLFSSGTPLFEPTQPDGRLQIQSLQKGHPGFESHWSVTQKRVDGSPQTVVGSLRSLLIISERDQAVSRAEILLLEIQRLRACVNPHLLYNCLTGLRGLIAEKPEQARHYVGVLARFLRNAVDSQNELTISIADELSLCVDFCALEEMRGRPVRLDVQVDLHAQKRRIPPLTLVGLVENAVKHGQPDPSGKIPVVLQTAWQKQGALEVLVRQPGQLISKTNNPSGQGLSMIRQQLEKLMPAPTTLSLREAPRGWVEALILIPA